MAAALMTGTAAAQVEANSTEGGDVTVGVSSTIAVDVQPANLDYSNAQVGNRNASSDRGFGAIEIENTGSEYIDRIWLNASTPGSDPFGTGSPTAYDSGNFLEVRPQDGLTGSSQDWHYINRKEYMWSSSTAGDAPTIDTEIPSYIQSDFTDPYEVGAINRGNETIYFVAKASDSGDTCQNTEVRVGNVSATDTRLGTVDFTSGTEFGWESYKFTSVATNDYGVAHVDLNWTYTNSASDSQYDLVANCDPTSQQPHVYVNRYNVNTAGSDDLTTYTGAHTNYLLNTNTASNMLKPGEMATVQTAINVPEGVAAGSVDPGKLRVLITADESAST